MDMLNHDSGFAKDTREAGPASTGEIYGYHKPGAAITSMVLGICSVSLWFSPFVTSIPCIIMGIVAVVLAGREEGKTDPKYRGFLKAGRITGIIGASVSGIYTLMFLIQLVSRS